ncbi:transcriptional regulator, partial [Gordonia alkanivorans]|nr:transcriptional regulator [Gordonia alkanivorans]MDH3026711.1 transcriptional regulator [Gordonia alkanivorans]MDH3048176.1 transcriptional regulator [Gordonia alkanivorans]MDH3048239.1 transcriptional regulator [Gordonia alkanivorans]MDH3051998.1 transcriptional regulator [Gordonia alkanivorans]
MSNKNLLLSPGRGLSGDETGAVTPLLKALADPVRLRLLSEVAAHP